MSVSATGVRDDRAGVVDDDVDAAEVCGGLVDRVLHRGLVAHVDRERQGAAAGLLDLFGGGVDRAFELGMRRLGFGGDRRCWRRRARRVSAIASPMPREAPVMNSVLPLSDIDWPLRSRLARQECVEGAARFRAIAAALRTAVPPRRSARQISSGAPRIRLREIGHGLRAAGRRFSRGLHGSASTSPGATTALTQPACLGCGGIEGAAHHQKLEGARDAPSGAGPSRLDAASGTRPRRRRASRTRIGAGDHMVAVQQHRGADADRETLHRRDQRPLGSRQRMEKADHRQSPDLRRRRRPAENSARSLPAEKAPGAPAITTQRMSLSPLALSSASAIACVHRGGQRVLLVRAVHPHDADRRRRRRRMT